ncbi:MAG: hypothetical protein EA353_08045 [Puniceicoccaceae bacterium]|nr:MAG: hypothetical protein EA353_08045 [Puniceicoccaceae bacterium]
MNHPLKSILLLLLVFIVGAFLFVAWLGGSLKGEPVWIPWVSVVTGILFLGAWVAGVFRGAVANTVKWTLLTVGGIGLAAIMVQLLIIEPHQRSESQANNNRLLYERRLEAALTRVHCPAGNILVVVPGIEIVVGEGTRQMLELYLLPPDPSQRALKLANTRYDGTVVHNPALAEMRPKILDCFASARDLSALLQQMEGGLEDWVD